MNCFVWVLELLAKELLCFDLTFTGKDASLLEFGHNDCVPVRVSFSSPGLLSNTPMDAYLVTNGANLEVEDPPIQKPSN
jgi:hypothetical protein